MDLNSPTKPYLMNLIFLIIDAFKAYKGDFYCVVTNLLTGEAEYMKYTGKDRTNTVLKATCALPMLFPPIIINDTPYMDGGLTDSIPFMRALEDGCDRVLVVLTREAGYTKTTSTSTKAIAVIMKRNILSFQRLCFHAAERYNECLKQLKEYEDSGKVMVIRPAVSKGFSRLEKDKNKILSMYNDGYKQGYALTGDIKKFFNYSNS